MNVLIHNTTSLWEKHISESVEIAINEIKNQNNVFWIQCEGELASCPANYSHDEDKCKECVNRNRHIIDNVLNKKVRVIKLKEIKNYINYLQFESLSELRDWKYNDLQFGRLVVSEIITNTRSVNTDVKTIINPNTLKRVNSAISLYYQSKEVIQKYNIDCVYIWNGRRGSDGPVAIAASELGVDYKCHILSGNGMYFTSNAWPVHNYIQKKNFIRNIVSNIGEKEVINTAKLFFENNRNGENNLNFAHNFETPSSISELHPELITLKKPIISIFTSSLWEFFAIDGFGLRDKELGGNMYDLLVQLLENKSKDYHYVVRWHPNLKNSGIEEKAIINRIITSKKNIDVTHISSEDLTSSYEIIEMSEKVITFGSLIGVEATYYDRPSILIGTSYYDDLDVTYKINCLDELYKLIKIKHLSPKKKWGSYVYGFFIMNNMNYQFKWLKHSEDFENFNFNGTRIGFKKRKFRKQTRMQRLMKSLKRRVFVNQKHKNG